MVKVKMNVVLEQITENPIELIYKAYRVCYSALPPTKIKLPLKDDGTKDYEKMIKFIKPLIKSNHLTPLEHVSFTFNIENVSRSLLAQLTRHRSFKFNVKSQRYVSEKDFDYIIPIEIEKNQEVLDMFLEIMEYDQNKYQQLADKLLEQYMKKEEKLRWDFPCTPLKSYLEEFWNSKDGKSLRNSLRKKAYENARAILPNACATNLIVTMDARNFRNFIAQRQCSHAQEEIRELATQMNKIIKEQIPFIDYGARWCGVFCNECISGGDK